MKKRWLALLLCAALLSPLCACASRSPAVMRYGETELGASAYRYWLSCYRARFYDRETAENRGYYAALADENIKKSLAAVALFDGYGLRLGDVGHDTVDAAMQRLVESFGGRAAFDEAAARYGTDYDGVRAAVTYEQKSSALYSYLFGTGGVYEIEEKDYEAAYQKTYTHVRMIFIPYVDYILSEDGDKIYDTASGTYLFREKTGAALRRQEEKSAAVRAALADGVDDAAFSELVETYNEDESAKEYPGGYYFSSEVDYTDYIPDLTEAALRLRTVGETCEVRSAYGVHFLYRLENEEGAYKAEANGDFFEGFTDRVKRSCFEDIIVAAAEQVVIVTEEKNKIRYDETEPNYDMYW